jgi:hypothetical protein
LGNTHDRIRTCDLRIRSPLHDSTSNETADTCNSPPATPNSTPNKTADDPDLRRVIDAWPTLPAAIRDGMAAMVEAARGKGGKNR